jgi:hypothetical protein
MYVDSYGIFSGYEPNWKRLSVSNVEFHENSGETRWRGWLWVAEPWFYTPWTFTVTSVQMSAFSFMWQVLESALTWSLNWPWRSAELATITRPQLLTYLCQDPWKSIYECKVDSHVYPLSIISCYNKHVCLIQYILTFPTHSSVTLENCTHDDKTFFTQNDLRNNLLKL